MKKYLFEICSTKHSTKNIIFADSYEEAISEIMEQHKTVKVFEGISSADYFYPKKIISLVPQESTVQQTLYGLLRFWWKSRKTRHQYRFAELF